MNSFSSILRSKWREYLLEMLVIMFGILIALWLNNWNDNRKENIEEQKILNVLAQEFEGNIENLDSILISHRSNLNKIGTVLPKLSRPELKSNNNEMFPEIRNAIYGKTYNPMFGVMNSLLNSDKINLIDNEELKYSLARLPGLLDDYSEEEQLILKIIFEMILPEVMKIEPEKDYKINSLLNNLIGGLSFNLADTIEEGILLKTEMMRIYNLIESEINRG